MNELRVRDARAHDREAIAEVTISAYQEYAAAMPGLWEAYRQNIVSTLAVAELSSQIVAEIDAALVGSVLLYPEGIEMPAAGRAPMLLAAPEVRLLAVAPAMRKRGIGEALMHECLRRSRQRGAQSLTLHTIDFMQSAMRMYERIGFRRDPDLDFEPAPGAFVKGYRFRFDGVGSV